MNCLVFLSSMTIDTLLTSEIARERIGRLVELPEGYAPQFRLYLPIPGNKMQKRELFEDSSFTFALDKQYFDCSWQFDESSGLARALKNIRKKQASVGFLDPKTVRSHERFDNSYVSAFHNVIIHSYHEELEKRGLNFFYRVSDGNLAQGTKFNSFDEALLNAIEHGSDYCKTGPVNVRFLGGESGFAFFIDNPANEFTLRPYTIDELTQLYAQKYGAIPKDPTTLDAFRGFQNGYQRVVDQNKYDTYNNWEREQERTGKFVPTDRGNGIVQMTLDTKATVGFERREDVNRIIVGYFV